MTEFVGFPSAELHTLCHGVCFGRGASALSFDCCRFEAPAYRDLRMTNEDLILALRKRADILSHESASPALGGVWTADLLNDAACVIVELSRDAELRIAEDYALLVAHHDSNATEEEQWGGHCPVCKDNPWFIHLREALLRQS